MLNSEVYNFSLKPFLYVMNSSSNKVAMLTIDGETGS